MLADFFLVPTHSKPALGSKRLRPNLPPELTAFRPTAWENDISLNHHAMQVFENLASPKEMAIESFETPSDLTPELLGGQPLHEFIQRDGYPLPCSDDREDDDAGCDAQYFLNGLADFLKIQLAAKECEINIESYFDFGSSSGSVLRHFCAQTKVQDLWGCDINGRHVGWMNDHLPEHVKIFHSHGLAKLPMASNSMDVISAFSVFTQIDVFETAWMSELHRILKPSGMVYFTVHNEATWQRMQTAKAEGAGDDLLVRLRQIDSNVDRMLENELPDGRTDFRYSDVGPCRSIVLFSNSHLEQTWGRYFDIVEIRPSWHHGGEQAVFVGRKKS